MNISRTRHPFKFKQKNHLLFIKDHLLTKNIFSGCGHFQETRTSVLIKITFQNLGNKLTWIMSKKVGQGSNTSILLTEIKYFQERILYKGL